MISSGAANDDASASELQGPADVDWNNLDKSKFFFLGAALFSGVSAALYPMVVLKTRQQVSLGSISCLRTALSVLHLEGLRGFYRGFGTSLVGTIPARALYMTALELTKSNVGTATARLGLSESTATTVANGAAGMSAAVAAQLVWTPIDVVSQRLMVQGATKSSYNGGIDAFKKIICRDGLRGLYRGFGISIFTYAPSSAAWWATYSAAHRLMWGGIGRYSGGFGVESKATEVGVEGLSAAVASGVSAVVTMPLDTIKTRLQVLDGEGKGRGAVETVKRLVMEGGVGACYRGLGARWASMSLSAATMVTTYELLKRLSVKSTEPTRFWGQEEQMLAY
ncbi:hypothetical protein NMG60_11001738 [Bertholletia excelsa]